MNMLRRHSALIAALVLTCVGAQTLDMGLCCASSAHDPSEAATEAAVSMIGTGYLYASGALPPASSKGPGTSDHPAYPDCLCHLVFTSVSVAPTLLVAPASTPLAAEAPQLLRFALLSPPGPVPIA